MIWYRLVVEKEHRFIQAYETALIGNTLAYYDESSHLPAHPTTPPARQLGTVRG